MWGITKAACNQLIIQSRTFASSAGRIFRSELSHEQSQLALKNVKRSVRGNPVDARRTFWFNSYLSVLKSRFLFVIQNNNIPASVYQELRKDLLKINIESLLVRNAVFAAACKSQGKGNMKNLFQGQTLVWFSNATDAESPNLVKDVAAAIKKHNHLLLVGADLEGMLVTAQNFEQVVKMPSKQQLYGELLNLLAHPGSSIARILEQNHHALALTLDQRLRDMSSN